MVLLVKPQFEAGRQEVSRGRGVITDPEIHQRAIEAVTTSVEQCGGSVESVVESPIKGAEGNIEFLMWVKCPIRCLGCVS
jgi:23S rRNA (cytidine1920-2'-O)/16S rRNA (cytidine1409-2'-O)-methyltransferase